MVNYTLPVAQPMGRFADLPLLLCAWNVVASTHHQNDTFVTLLAGAAVML